MSYLRPPVNLQMNLACLGLTRNILLCAPAYPGQQGHASISFRSLHASSCPRQQAAASWLAKCTNYILGASVSRLSIAKQATCCQPGSSPQLPPRLAAKRVVPPRPPPPPRPGEVQTPSKRGASEQAPPLSSRAGRRMRACCGRLPGCWTGRPQSCRSCCSSTRGSACASSAIPWALALPPWPPCCSRCGLACLTSPVCAFVLGVLAGHRQPSTGSPAANVPNRMSTADLPSAVCLAEYKIWLRQLTACAGGGTGDGQQAAGRGHQRVCCGSACCGLPRAGGGLL